MTEWAYTRNTEFMEHDPPLLFNLHNDPSEQYDVAADHPEVIEKILAVVAAHNAQLVAGPDQLAERGGARSGDEEIPVARDPSAGDTIQILPN